MIDGISLSLDKVAKYSRSSLTKGFAFHLYSNKTELFHSITVFVESEEQADAFEAFLKTVIEKKVAHEI